MDENGLNKKNSGLNSPHNGSSCSGKNNYGKLEVNQSKEGFAELDSFSRYFVRILKKPNGFSLI